MLPFEKLQLLYKKERNNTLSAGFIMIFTSVILILIPEKMTLITGIALLFIGVLLILSNIFRPVVNKHPVFLALKNNPERISHFYLKEFRSRISFMHIPLGEKKETRLMVRIDNKKTYNMPVKGDWYIIRELLREKCPGASEYS